MGAVVETWYVRIGLTLLASISAIGVAAAQNECDAVLKRELQVADLRTSDRAQATRNFACSHDFQEFNDTYGGKARGQYGLITGGIGYDQGNYKQYQQEHCSDATAADHASGFHYYVQRDASAGVVSAWQECMANLEGLHCWAEPVNPDISIVLSLREVERYTISDSTLSGATLQSAPASIAPGQVMPYGQKRIVVRRPNQRTSILFTLNITTGAHGRSCHVAIPAELKLPNCYKPGTYEDCSDPMPSGADLPLCANCPRGAVDCPKGCRMR
jgi:hypothetical protein